MAEQELDVLEAGTGRAVLAVRPPREEEEPTAYDDDGGSEPDLVPDPVEDQDPEDAEQENRDERGGVFRPQSHCVESTTAQAIRATAGRNGS